MNNRTVTPVPSNAVPNQTLAQWLTQLREVVNALAATEAVLGATEAVPSGTTAAAPFQAPANSTLLKLPTSTDTAYIKLPLGVEGQQIVIVNTAITTAKSVSLTATAPQTAPTGVLPLAGVTEVPAVPTLMVLTLTANGTQPLAWVASS